VNPVESDPRAEQRRAASDALHERVRAFARGATNDTFEVLACELARFQARFSPGYARLVDSRGSSLASVDDIPPVPSDVFRLTRVATHPATEDSACFITSGTTASPGSHPMRTLETYETVSLLWGRAALRPRGEARAIVVALAPKPVSPPRSSLGHMMRSFMSAFDATPLIGHPEALNFDPDAPQRWLLNPGGVALEELLRAARIANERQVPLLVLATSFALVYLLDALHGDTILCPRKTVVMQTGGFKGRSREVPAAELREAVARAFRITPGQVISEYGMTELSSQLYEGTLPQGELEGPPDVLLPPPWLRVAAVDPVSLTAVPEGRPGLARFIDLANVDSAVSIVTQDLIVRAGAGVRLQGRSPGAIARGCSLTIEELALASPRWNRGA
jgi:hypothetical protein